MTSNKYSDAFGQNIFADQQYSNRNTAGKQYLKACGLVLSGYLLARLDLRPVLGFASLKLLSSRGNARLVGDVQWGKCSGIDDPRIECGSIVVPLDYFDSTAGTATIALAKYKAKPSLRRGSVFVNPGGPGGSGTMLATRAGQWLSVTRIGPYYDIVGFDPRGAWNECLSLIFG
ncbi:hypothetical protein FS749_002226 [Ceratobasidium sp. UAMH 11750]|nr:hypothetical protein FS749_002226 [Ceratobasidium sp. UAMH 11750]